MNYRDAERKRMVEIRDDIFRDPGWGLYRGIERAEVLKDSRLNLWEGIREDALEYFDRCKIVWWDGGKENQVTGHLLSSQVACVNHLFFLRQRKDVATTVLKNICPQITDAVVVDEGYVEFEVIGSKNYLRERSHTRGAHATSVDAVMVGRKKDGMNILVMIEWKYTEKYSPKNQYEHKRSKYYDPILAESDCPIQPPSFESLYYEPFYQLMRQTLLGWKMVQSHEYNCDEYIHLHVIPSDNRELKERVTSPDLTGETMSEAWQNALRNPSQYQVLSPESFLLPIERCLETSSIFSYLNRRYWRNAYDKATLENFME